MSTYKLGLAGAEGLESRLLAHGDLSTLHDQSQTAGDGVTGFLCLYGSLVSTNHSFLFFFFPHDAVDGIYTYLGHCDDALDLVVKGYGTMVRVERECVKE